MGFYLRKSFGMGPLRLNLSKSGFGVSAGVRGARVGINSRGRSYVHCGRHGIYYRKFLDQPSASPARGRATVHRRAGPRSVQETVGEQVAIDSGDTAAMVPETAAELLEDIRRKRRMVNWHRWFGIAALLGAASAAAAEIYLFSAFLTIAAIVGAVGLAIWVRRRRTLTLIYNLDADYTTAWGSVVSAFAELRKADRVWLIESEAVVRDTKYHAGAGSTVRRSLIAPSLERPPSIRSNVEVLYLPAGRQSLYFLPDRLLVYEGMKVGAVEYDELRIEAGATKFIEEGQRPRDAEVVGKTWRYVNRKGGPDRRFKDNRELPVMQYGVLRFRSRSGLNEEFQASRLEASMAFARNLEQLPSTAQVAADAR